MCCLHPQMRKYLNCTAVSALAKSWENSVRKPKTKHANKKGLQQTLDQANVTPFIS